MDYRRCLSIINELIHMSRRKSEYGHSVFSMIIRFKEEVGGTVEACKCKEKGRFVRLTYVDNGEEKLTVLSLKINDKPERYEFDIVDVYPDLTKDTRVLNIIKKLTESYGLVNRTGELPYKRKVKKARKKRKLKR